METDGWVRPKPGADDLIWDLNAERGWDHLDYHRSMQGPSKLRKLHHMVRWGTGVQYRVHCPDVQTAVRGLLERVFYHWETDDEGERHMVRPYRPEREVVFATLGPARNALLRHTWEVSPWTREQFLAPLSSSKLARYTEAADSFEAEPISPKDAYLQTFVKAEKLNVTAKSDPDPRVIQPRRPRFNYAVGRYTKAAEKMLYKAIDKLFGNSVPTVMKGLNADKRGAAFARAWGLFDNPVAVGLDASRFDEHVSRGMLEFEHSVYLAIFRHDRELAEYLNMQLRNKGFVRSEDGYVRYRIEGSRMSGDINTSEGNIILMCLMVYAYMFGKGFRYHLFNDGDDCVLIFERENLADLDDLPEWFAAMGMIMKVEEPVYELELVEFCQSHPIEVDPGVWRMVRDPRVTLSKDLAIVKPVRDEATWTRYRYAVGQCGLALAGDLPVLNHFYHSLQKDAVLSKRQRARMRRRGPETGMEYLALGMSPKFSEPSTCARISFAKAFDIWPDMQIAMEREYARRRAQYVVPKSTSYVVDIFHLFR